MSVVLDELVRSDLKILGLCTARPPAALKRLKMTFGRWATRIGLREDKEFHYRDPFAHLSMPHVLARRNGIAVSWSDRLRSTAFRQEMENLAPDYILVAGFHRLIPESLFGLARKAAINVHPAPLPGFRGGTPNRWVVRKGSDKTALTAHWLDAQFDTGPVLIEQPISISQSDCWGDVERHVLDELPQFVRRIILTLSDPQPPRIAQDEVNASYDHSYNGRYLLIDWSRTSREILRQCLAIRPASGARTSVGGKTICVWNVKPVSAAGEVKPPGCIVSFDADMSPIISCGDGLVKITQILRAGVIRPGSDATERLRLKIGQELAFNKPLSGHEPH